MGTEDDLVALVPCPDPPNAPGRPIPPDGGSGGSSAAAAGTSGSCVCPKRVAADTLRNMRRLTNTLLIAILTSPLATTATAFAQNAPRDPNIGQGQRTSVWLGYLVAGLFAVILVGLTLFPSKRQSQDL